MRYLSIKAIFDEKIKEYKQRNPSVKDSELKYKRCEEYFILLFIPDHVDTNESRPNVKDPRYAKFRAKEAYCIGIFDSDFSRWCLEYTNEIILWDGGKEKTLLYRVDTWIQPDGFDTCLETVCTSGIHYFNSLLAAYANDPLPFWKGEMRLLFADDGHLSHLRMFYKWMGESETESRFEEISVMLQKEFTYTLLHENHRKIG